MKNLLKRLSLFLAACAFVCIAPLSAFATGNYTYTVTLSMGRQGAYDAAAGSGFVVTDAAGSALTGYTCTATTRADGTTDGFVLSGLPLGARVVFYPQSSNSFAMPDDSKYYVKGVRLSGRDNNTVASAAFPVTADADYVVAYGIKGDMTQYTVNYVDASGVALAPSETYYGNVNDTPVIAYLYVDGYQPQSYNLTKRLTANAADNAFTFIYTPIAPLDGGEETVIVTNPVTLPGTGGTGTGGTAGAGGTANGGTGTNDTTNLPDNTTPNDSGANAPQEIVDLDDSETPLGNLVNNLTKASPFVWLGIGLVAVLIVAIVILLLMKKRTRKEKKS